MKTVKLQIEVQRLMDDVTFQLIAKALSDPKRVEILTMLVEGELCCSMIVERLGTPQPTCSHHLRELVRAGLLEIREEKQYNYFRVRSQVIDAYRDELARRFVIPFV